MEARVRVLASGSSGNALFVSFGNTRLLVDAGVSIKQLEGALAEIGERPDDLSAVLVTHEHADHVAGLNALQSRWAHVPIRATSSTARQLERRDIARVDGPPLAGGLAIHVGDVRVAPFAVDHDAAEPVGFRFDWGDFSMAVATDLGTARPHIEAMLAGCRVLMLEANHDPDMLRNGPYPAFLKRRIASVSGHLSNRQSAALVSRVASPALERVVLAHLSNTNNTPQLAVAEVSRALDGRCGAHVEAAAPRAPGALHTFDVRPGPLRDLPRVCRTSRSSAPAETRKTTATHQQPRLFE
jgi:phosphoribosyl 1,2-cyclic phosphodiesterase